MFRSTRLLGSKLPSMASSGSFFRPLQSPVRRVSTQDIFSAIFSENKDPVSLQSEIERTKKAINNLEVIHHRASKIAEDAQKELYFTRDVFNLLKTLPSEKTGYQQSCNDFKEEFVKGLSDAISKREHQFKFETDNFNDAHIVYYFRSILEKYGFDISIRHFYHDDYNCNTKYKVSFPEGLQLPLNETPTSEQSKDLWLTGFISQVETLVLASQDQQRLERFSLTGC